MALFSRVHVWVSNEVLTASDLNNEFNNLLTNAVSTSYIGYSASVNQMKTTVTPGTVGNESLASSIADEITRIRFMLQAIVGGSQWYDLADQQASLGTGGIGAAAFAAGSVETAAIADAAVTLPKLAAKNTATSGTSGPFTTNSTSAVAIITAQTITMTVASPAVVTLATANSYSVGDPIVFTTTGALPTGVTPSATYYVLTVPTSMTLTFSATVGGAAINTTGSQSGTQTATNLGLTASITTSGRSIKAKLIADDAGVASSYIENANVSGTHNGFATVEILRGATLVYSTPIGTTISPDSSSPNHYVVQPDAIALEEELAAGTYTYTVKVLVAQSTQAINVNAVRLKLEES